MQKEKYGFFTAVTMITGIVIGSGIFFKSDNILEYTNGNVTLGILVFDGQAGWSDYLCRGICRD